MINLDNILKSRDVILPTKVRLVKAMVFPVVMYGCERGCHFLLQCIKVKSESEVIQSCPTLSDPMDCSPPGSSVHKES